MGGGGGEHIKKREGKKAVVIVSVVNVVQNFGHQPDHLNAYYPDLPTNFPAV